jgi:crossover junction endodeoxyribonuclease RuvC
MGISPKEFQQLEARVASGGRKPSALNFAPAAPPGAGSHSIILGVDPSLRGTGFGIIRLEKSTPRAIDFGTIHCPAGWDRSRCLAKIATTLRDVIAKNRPSVCAIEGLFYAQNLQTALIMGEARGAALASIAEAGLEIFEMAPRKVKQAIVGYGAAQKLAVAKMVQRTLQLEKEPDADAADALALALAFAQSNRRFSLEPLRRV